MNKEIEKKLKETVELCMKHKILGGGTGIKINGIEYYVTLGFSKYPKRCPKCDQIIKN